MLSNANGLDSFGLMVELPVITGNNVPGLPYSAQGVSYEDKQQLLEVYREDLLNLSFDIIYPGNFKLI
jgi:hypothetical protein